MYQVILVFHIIAAVVIIGLVLIQQGKGATIGAAFGSGASSTVFGSQGSGGFLFRLTSGAAAVFFATSLALSYIVSSEYKASQSVSPMDIKKPSVEIPAPSKNIAPSSGKEDNTSSKK